MRQMTAESGVLGLGMHYGTWAAEPAGMTVAAHGNRKGSAIRYVHTNLQERLQQPHMPMCCRKRREYIIFVGRPRIQYQALKP